MSEKKTLKMIIDRVEGDLAVIVLADDDAVKFNLPVNLLPEDIHDGEHLQVTFALDRDSRAAAKQKVADLLKELTGKKD